MLAAFVGLREHVGGAGVPMAVGREVPGLGRRCRHYVLSMMVPAGGVVQYGGDVQPVVGVDIHQTRLVANEGVPAREVDARNVIPRARLFEGARLLAHGPQHLTVGRDLTQVAPADLLLPAANPARASARAPV